MLGVPPLSALQGCLSALGCSTAAPAALPRASASGAPPAAAAAAAAAAVPPLLPLRGVPPQVDGRRECVGSEAREEAADESRPLADSSSRRRLPSSPSGSRCGRCALQAGPSARATRVSAPGAQVHLRLLASTLAADHAPPSPTRPPPTPPELVHHLDLHRAVVPRHAVEGQLRRAAQPRLRLHRDAVGRQQQLRHVAHNVARQAPAVQVRLQKKRRRWGGRRERARSRGVAQVGLEEPRARRRAGEGGRRRRAGVWLLPPSACPRPCLLPCAARCSPGLTGPCSDAPGGAPGSGEQVKSLGAAAWAPGRCLGNCSPGAWRSPGTPVPHPEQATQEEPQRPSGSWRLHSGWRLPGRSETATLVLYRTGCSHRPVSWYLQRAARTPRRRRRRQG